MKEKIILTLGKMVRKTYSRLLQQVLRLSQKGRKIGLNSEYSRDIWGFIARQQSEGDGGSGWNLTKGREILLNRHNRVLAEGRPRTIHQR